MEAPFTASVYGILVIREHNTVVMLILCYALITGNATVKTKSEKML